MRLQDAQSEASMRPPLSAGEIPSARSRIDPGTDSFNEAPAERGGNRAAVAAGTCWADASMRPPLSAGEIRGRPEPVRCRGLASMRPPLSAGEIEWQVDEGICLTTASMRPPLSAGEIVVVGVAGRVRDIRASMRPPLSAGEIPPTASAWRRGSSRFNEAPAERGGNPH